MSGAGPSRRKRGSIARGVHVRLDAEQAKKISMQEAATGRSAAAILLMCFDEKAGTIPAIPSVPKILPAAADAAMLLTARQIGGLLGKGIRERSLPADSAEKALKSLEQLMAIYAEKINHAS